MMFPLDPTSNATLQAAASASAKVSSTASALSAISLSANTLSAAAASALQNPLPFPPASGELTTPFLFSQQRGALPSVKTYSTSDVLSVAAAAAAAATAALPSHLRPLPASGKLTSPLLKAPSQTVSCLSAEAAAALPSHLLFSSTSPASAFSLSEQALERATQKVKNFHLSSKGYYVSMESVAGQVKARVYYLNQGEISSELIRYDQLDTFITKTVPVMRGSLDICPESLGEYLLEKWLEGARSKVADTYLSTPSYLYVGGCVPYRKFDTESQLFPTIYMIRVWEKNQSPKCLYFTTHQACKDYMIQKSLSNAFVRDQDREAYIALAAPALYRKMAEAEKKPLLFFFIQPGDVHACLIKHDGEKVTTKMYDPIEEAKVRLEKEKRDCHHVPLETLVNEAFSQAEVDYLDEAIKTELATWVGDMPKLQEREYVSFSKLSYYQIVIFRPANEGREKTWRLGFFRAGNLQYQQLLDFFVAQHYTRVR